MRKMLPNETRLDEFIPTLLRDATPDETSLSPRRKLHLYSPERAGNNWENNMLLHKVLVFLVIFKYSCLLKWISKGYGRNSCYIQQGFDLANTRSMMKGIYFMQLHLVKDSKLKNKSHVFHSITTILLVVTLWNYWTPFLVQLGTFLISVAVRHDTSFCRTKRGYTGIWL